MARRIRTGAGRLTPIFADDYSSVRVDGLSYFDLKVRAGLFGGGGSPERLTDEQREFVGLYPPRPHHGSPNGWRSVTTIALFDFVDGSPSDEYEDASDGASVVVTQTTARRLQER